MHRNQFPRPKELVEGEQIEVTQERPQRIEYIKTFADARIHPVTLKNIELYGYEVPIRENCSVRINIYCIKFRPTLQQ